MKISSLKSEIVLASCCSIKRVTLCCPFQVLFTCRAEISSLRLILASAQVRDELEQLLGDDDDMADLFLTRKMFGASSPFPSFRAPTIASSLNRGAATSTNSNDVDELEMLLEVLLTIMLSLNSFWIYAIGCHCCTASQKFSPYLPIQLSYFTFVYLRHNNPLLAEWCLFTWNFWERLLFNYLEDWFPIVRVFIHITCTLGFIGCRLILRRLMALWISYLQLSLVSYIRKLHGRTLNSWFLSRILEDLTGF